jgi:hypothetical protein
MTSTFLKSGSLSSMIVLHLQLIAFFSFLATIPLYHHRSLTGTSIFPSISNTESFAIKSLKALCHHILILLSLPIVPKCASDMANKTAAYLTKDWNAATGPTEQQQAVQTSDMHAIADQRCQNAVAQV